MKVYSANLEQKYGATVTKTRNVNKSKKTGPDTSSIVSSAIDNNKTDKTSENKENITNATNVNGKQKSADTNEIKKDKSEHKKTVRSQEVESLEDDLDMILSLEGTTDKIANKVEKVGVQKGQQKYVGKGSSDDTKMSNKPKEKVNDSKGKIV